MKKMTHMIKLMMVAVAVAVCACSGGGNEAPTAQAAQEAPRDTIGELVSRVQTTGRLYAMEYQVHKLVSYDDVRRLRGSVLGRQFDVRLPQADRKVLIPVDAVIKGYIDFSGFSADNVRISDNHITVILPDPTIEVTSTKVDHLNIKEYVGFGRLTFTAAELADLEKQGRAAIVASIPQMDIVADTRRSGYDALVPMLAAMGYAPENITVEFASDFTPADYAHKIIRLDSNLK